MFLSCKKKEKTELARADIRQHSPITSEREMSFGGAVKGNRYTVFSLPSIRPCQFTVAILVHAMVIQISPLLGLDLKASRGNGRAVWSERLMLTTHRSETQVHGHDERQGGEMARMHVKNKCYWRKIEIMSRARSRVHEETSQSSCCRRERIRKEQPAVPQQTSFAYQRHSGMVLYHKRKASRRLLDQVSLALAFERESLSSSFNQY